MFYMHINYYMLYILYIILMTSLPCKKFKITFTLKRGHKGQFICLQKYIKSAAIYE